MSGEQAIFLQRNLRPATKASVKRSVKAKEPVYLEALRPGEYHGSVYSAPAGRYFFVGPHPYNRKFYGQIVVKSDGKIVVK